MIFESWEIVGTDWLGVQHAERFQLRVWASFFGGGRWEKLLMGVRFVEVDARDSGFVAI